MWGQERMSQGNKVRWHRKVDDRADLRGNRLADGKLDARFFYSRNYSDDRSNLWLIFPALNGIGKQVGTRGLSFQLAYPYHQFREQLLLVLQATPDVGRESLCFQLEKVIICPLKATQISTLIIIDAPDECRDKEPTSALLSVRNSRGRVLHHSSPRAPDSGRFLLELLR